MLKQQQEIHEQALRDLEIEHRMKIDQMSSVCKDYQHEKESMVMRYAQAERSNCEMTERLQRAETKIREWTKERDVALGKWKALKEERTKLSELCDAKASELTSLKRELDKQRELVSSTDIKLKWNQNKLKSEQDAHKETKTKLERSEKSLKEFGKEILGTWEQLRSMYVILQNSDTISSALQSKLDECRTANPDDACSLMRKDINTLSFKLKEVMEELRTFRDKVRCLEVERLNQEDVLSTFRDSLQSQRSSNSDLRDRLMLLERTETMLNESNCKLTVVTRRLEEMELTNSELVSEIEKLTQREAEQLEFSSRLAEKSSCLQADNSRLSAQIDSLTTELQSVTEKYSVLLVEKHSLEKELARVTASFKEEIDCLLKKVSEQQQTVESTKQRLEDAEDEMKTQKRRHANNVKDLLRQLQQVTRRMELQGSVSSTANGTTVDSMSLGSLGSHGGSCGSLDTAGLLLVSNNVDHCPAHEESPRLSSLKSMQGEDQQGALMEEVDSLRRALIRKNEKIEFLKDHIDQLIEELHRKSRIIQGYIIRDEGGSLTSESSDRSKVHLVKKGGIMASLYSSQSMDESMTLNLSLQINNKLQALLEDTLLKNIKLKEGMDTLGKEIDWLKRENTRLKNELTSSVKNCEQLVDISDEHS
jgi:chromosome segregation ATPase